LEFKDLRSILLRIKSSQEELSERITRIEEETQAGFIKLEKQVEKLRRFNSYPFQNTMNANSVETVIEGKTESENKLSITKIEGNSNEMAELTRMKEIGMVKGK